MDPRIDKLLRQRDLLREHLNWIEEEIVAAHPQTAPHTRVSPAEPPNEIPAKTVIESPSPVDSVAETIVPEPDARNVHSEVRAGCMLYFGIATAALGLLIAYIYWRY